MLDLIAFIIFIIIISYFTISNIRIRNDNLQLIGKLMQANIDIEILKSVVDSHKTDTEKDHLITFLGETRESAYTYISETQDKLQNFVNDIEKDIEVLKTKSKNIEQKDIIKLSKKIIKHHKIIKDMLPKEEDNGR